MVNNSISCNPQENSAFAMSATKLILVSVIVALLAMTCRGDHSESDENERLARVARDVQFETMAAASEEASAAAEMRSNIQGCSNCG
jgi:hypothetical protein